LAPTSPRQPGKEWIITAYGARSGETNLNTEAIQAAIDRCSESGGGTVVVPAGTFVTGALFLRAGVDLHLQANAILNGSSNTNDYPWINTRIAGLEMRWPAALINADGLTNLTISGPGTIDGSGERWWKEYWDARAAEPDRVDPHFKVGRPRLVHLIRCRNVAVRDVLLKDSPFWNLQFTYCDTVLASNVTVRASHPTLRAASSDGIDLDSTRNALITHCDIECDDDAICLKSGRDADGLRVNLPTENVVVRHCRVGRAAGLVVFGSETSGGIRNVTISDCTASAGCGEIVRFKTRMGRGGVVEDILYENITAEGVREVFNFNMDAFTSTWLPEQFRQPVPPEQGTPIFRNITVRNLKATGAASAGRLIGLPTSPIRNLRLINIDIQARTGFTARHTQNLRFENVKVNGTLTQPPAPSADPSTAAGPLVSPGG
jgi:polygalacturonase